MTAALTAAQQVQEVVAVAAEEVRHSCGAASVSISRWERHADRLRVLVNVGDLGPGEQSAPVDETYPLPEFAFVAELLQHGRACYMALDDPDTDPRAAALLRELSKSTGLSVPIRIDGVTWGELFVTTTADQPPFAPADAALLQALADHVGLAIARAELLERLGALAFRDALTGLENRRALEERLERALACAQEHDWPVALILCDLDNLKQINDGGGHDAGDRALRHVADRLAALCAAQPAASAYRIGGDEFCLLLEHADVARAAPLARTATAQLADATPSIGISCGVASTRVTPPHSSGLLRAADAALYVAKRTGRGRVCVADSDPMAAWRAATPRPSARRALRDASIDVRPLIAAGLQLLEGPLAYGTVLDRLQALASTLAATLDAAGVAVSACRAGDDSVHTAFAVDRRTGHSAGADVSVLGDRFTLADYPLTAHVLTEQTSTLVDVDDPAGDPAEQALLRDFGMRSLLATGARRPDGDAWLVELYADAASRDLAACQGAVQLLIAEAIRGAP